jgi:hypothetical protein
VETAADGQQTETPYYQPDPSAFQPYTLGGYNSDPGFSECQNGTTCADAWALRIVSSSDIFIYGAGFYSWFDNYDESCIQSESCQLSMIETSFTQGLWLYDLFTKGAKELISPLGGIPPTLQSQINQTGFTSEVAAWLVLAEGGGDLGSNDGPGSGPEDGSGTVYIGETIFLTPIPTVQCYPPCTLVFPVSNLPGLVTWSFSPTKTTLTVTQSAKTITTVVTVTPSATTGSTVSFLNSVVTSGESSKTFALTSAIKPSPATITISGSPVVVFFPPTSVPSTAKSSSTTPVVYYTLPTTVYTSNGVTQTFSEDQDTDLRTITASTTITTTWTETYGSSSSSTSTTVVPIIIGPGGFYWKPIPIPDPKLPPFPIPKLPGLPPIPSPPCFKFLDIFSIDCPPNKGKPTTHFTSGPPKPTCTDKPKCGTVDNQSSDDESTSTSTCATQTQSSCNTITTVTPMVTNCFTFVGCECQTATVTDYWVSCAGGDSCTTTSSAVITGCHVTGTAVTTGAYCPLPTIDPSLEDVDDPLPPGVTITQVSTSVPGSAVIGGTTYTANGGGVVVVGGQTVTVVGVTVTEVITVGGIAGTVFPGFTGNQPSFIGYTNLGLGTTLAPPSGGNNPPPPPPPPPTSSTTGSGSSTSVANPPPPPPPPPSSTTGGNSGTPPPQPTAQLYIYYWSECDYGAVECTSLWTVYTPAFGVTYSVCDYLGSVDAPQNIKITDVPWPSGTLNFDFAIYGTSGCSYAADGTSADPGQLSCPDLTSPVTCQNVNYSQLQCDGELGIADVIGRVWCEWD